MDQLPDFSSCPYHWFTRIESTGALVICSKFLSCPKCIRLSTSYASMYILLPVPVVVSGSDTAFDRYYIQVETLWRKEGRREREREREELKGPRWWKKAKGKVEGTKRKLWLHVAQKRSGGPADRFVTVRTRRTRRRWIQHRFHPCRFPSLSFRSFLRTDHWRLFSRSEFKRIRLHCGGCVRGFNSRTNK